MPITKCTGTGCTVRMKCKRFVTPEVESSAQSWIAGQPTRGLECIEFVELLEGSERDSD